MAALFKCAICPYTSKHVSNVNRHQERHTAVKSRLCSEPGCGKAFSTSADLKQHASSHRGAGAVPCPQGCGYSAPALTLARTHAARCPRGPGVPVAKVARVFTCGLLDCAYSTTRSYSVLLHQRLHDPAKGYALACKACAFTTGSYQAYLIHVRQHNLRPDRAGGMAVEGGYAAAAREV